MKFRSACFILVAVLVSMIAGLNAPEPGPVSAQLNLDRSHLKITSVVAHDTHDDPVINNQIVVDITIEESGFPNDSDSGTLTLSPGSPPSYNWNCSECDDGFFTAVVACATIGGCDTNDAQVWLVGVQVSSTLRDLVRYDIDSDDLGNGQRYHSHDDCDDTVTPVDDTYTATDARIGWDTNTLCSDSGVAIVLSYE